MSGFSRHFRVRRCRRFRAGCLGFLGLLVLCSSARGILISEVQSWNRSTLKDQRGEYPDWIELWNPGPEAASLHGLFLSDQRNRLKYPLPSVELDPGEYHLVFASGEPEVAGYATFSISSEGEPVYLLNAAGQLLDWVEIPESQPDLSHGRRAGEDLLYYFDVPTPGRVNDSEAFSGITPPPSLSSPGGFVEGQPRVWLSHPDPDAQLWFSTDGREPPTVPYVPETGIHVFRSMVVRARAERPGFLPSPTTVRTFLINEPRTLPVICISTDPGNLFSKDHGIIWGENIWKDWEYPATVEFYETTGGLAFETVAGLSLHGSSARMAPIRPFRLSFRKDYGRDWLEWPMLPETGLSRFKRLVLRNAGNDYNHAYMRDALMTRLAASLNLETVGYRPVVSFLNGQFWAVYNLREKVDEYFISERMGLAPELIDLLEREGVPQAGTAEAYQGLVALMESVEGEVPGFDQSVQAWIDLDSFIDYQIAQIYCANRDSGKNRRLWRPRVGGGKWRWILNDTDAGFGGFGGIEFGQGVEYAFRNSMFDFATRTGVNVWPDYDWNTLFLRKLLMQPAFKERFLIRLADLLNQEFRSERVSGEIDAIADVIAPVMGRHFHKWRAPGTRDWGEDVEVLRQFAVGRPDNLRGHAVDFFQLPGVCRVTLRQSGTGAARIRVNSIVLEPSQLPWTGVVFQGLPLELELLPEPGTQAVGWTGGQGGPFLEIVPGAEELELEARVMDRRPRILAIGPAAELSGGVWLEFEGAAPAATDYRIQARAHAGDEWNDVPAAGMETPGPHRHRVLIAGQHSNLPAQQFRIVPLAADPQMLRGDDRR